MSANMGRMKFARPIRSLLSLAAAAVLLAACQSGPGRPVYPELSYAHLAPIPLNVADIQVERVYASPGTKPNVEQLFPVRPADAAERWARDRLRAVGAEGVAVVKILNASVVEVPLPRTSGLRGALTTDQSERYDGVLEVEIDVSSRSRGTSAMVKSRAQRSRSVAEDVTLNEREKVWFEMTEALMNDLNASLERQIYDNFGNFLGAVGSAAPSGAPASRGPIRSEPLPPR
jgi:hypothetical protein